jgi:hypothetical protein
MSRMASKRTTTDSGERKQREKSSPSSKTPRTKESHQRGHQLQSYSKLEDIRVLRTGLPAAVFEEWKRGFLIVLRVLYGDLAISLSQGSYYKPTVPSYASFARQRTAELQQEDTDANAALSTSASSARTTRTTARARTGSASTSQATAAATNDPVATGASSTAATAANTETDGTNATTAAATIAAAAAATLAARIARMVDTEYDDLTKIARREEKAMEANRVAMHASIWGKMSRESQERVRMNKFWPRVQTNKDPLALWQAICDTHAAFISGDDIYDTNQAWSY